MTDSRGCQGSIRERQQFRAYVGVGFGVFNVSLAAILIRLAQASTNSLAIAAWRLTLASLILTPVVLTRYLPELRRLERKDWGLMVASGVLLAIHFASWITSLAYTSVLASVALVSTTPIFVGLASHLVLREPLTRSMVVALMIATLGSATIAYGDLGTGTHRVLGDALALTGAVSGAGYFLIGRRLRNRLSLLAYVYPVYGTAAIVLIAWLLASSLPELPTTGQAWIWILLMAVGPQLLGHSALNWALRYLSATYVTIATLVEPVGSTVLAWLLLGEKPTVLAIAGGTVVLAAVVIASREEMVQ